jgi:hypothetical protein
LSELSPPAQPERPGAAAHPERRASLRYYFRQRPMVRFLVRPSFQCGRAFIKDICATGIGLLLTHEVTTGTVLFLQLRGRRRGTTLTQLARVVHVEPDGPGRWLVGCKLTCPLSDEELRDALRGDD